MQGNGNREHGDEQRKDCHGGSHYRWSFALGLGLVAAIVVVVGWRELYRANKRELALQRKLKADRSLLAALSEVPGRRFSVDTGHSEVIQRRKLFD